MLAHIDQDNIVGYFPLQSCSWAVRQHCISNSLKQGWLGQTDQENTVEVIFQRKHVCVLWANIAQIILCNVVQEAPGNIAVQILFNDVLTILKRHGTGKNPVQSCRRGSRQHHTGKKSCSVLSWHSWDNMVQVKNLCNVVQEVPDNIAQENILFNIFLMNTFGTTSHR